MPEDMIAAEIEPVADRARQTALALQRLGFRILHIGPTISVQGPKSLWEATFNVSFEPQTKAVLQGATEVQVTYQRAVVENMRVPAEVGDLVAAVMFAEPPELY